MDSDPKEFHFHVYFKLDNAESRASAVRIREGLEKKVSDGEFVVKLNKINDVPRGPHPIGSFETWCPIEYLSKVLVWFVMNHGEHPVLLHPLTKLEIKDHTERAFWLGEKQQLKLEELNNELNEIPLQFPELKLGYSNIK